MRLLVLILLVGGPAAVPAKEGAAPRAAASGTAAAAPAAKPPAAEPAAAQPAAPQPKLPPPKGSHVKPDDNMCFQCHNKPDQMDPKDPKLRRLYVPPEQLKQDVHRQKGVSCTDCHGGNYDTDKPNAAHALEDGFRAKPEQIRKFCVHCHASQNFELALGVHGKAGPKDARGARTPLACDKCHGTLGWYTSRPEFCNSCHARAGAVGQVRDL